MPKKLTYKFIKEQFEKEGYELLSKEYVNAHSKLRYKCPKGHKHDIAWKHWQQNHRCPYCYGNVRLTTEFIRSEFEKEGYKFLTKKYKNAHQKLDYICPNGHRHSTCWNNWHNLEHRCPFCAGVERLTIEFIRPEFEKEDYILLTKEYKNCSQKLDYICPKGHKHSITWNKWQQRQRCPECIVTTSKGEIEVRDFIKSLNIEVLSNDRNQVFNPETGNGLELDIFMPNLNKAIEYNGEYWHQDKTRDLLKQQLCKSKNIDLMTIWDKEWFNNSRECKEKIMKFMF